MHIDKNSAGQLSGIVVLNTSSGLSLSNLVTQACRSLHVYMPKAILTQQANANVT